MIINNSRPMQTTFEFCQKLSEIFPDTEFNLKNWTVQKHCGWTESLYEAQDGGIAVEYTQTRRWKYHFNGVIGVGDTLEDAIADHKVKYGEHLRTEE